jgi:RimJ/RimL family protein N-acetyltransferase
MDVKGLPKQLTLRNGTEVSVRGVEPGDEPALLDFFRALPEEDRLFLRDDVTDAAVITRIVESAQGELDVQLVAVQDDAVVGNATLNRDRHGWMRHVAEVRVVVARPLQRSGLGTALARVLVKHAVGLGLDKLVVQVVENQVGAVRAFEKLGFRPEAVLRGHVKDIHGMRRDLVVMSNDVSHIWERMESMLADFSPTLGG